MSIASGFFRTELVVVGVLLGVGGGCLEAGETPEDVQITEVSAVTGALGGCSNITHDEACFCTGAEWSGSCLFVNPTRRFYTNLTNLDGNGYFNDRIRSFVVGGHVRIKACKDDTYRGTCDVVTGLGGFSDLVVAAFYGQWKVDANEITSIYIDWKTEDCLNPGPFQVALFKDDNYNPRECTLISRPWSSGGTYPNAAFNADVNGLNGGFGWPHDSVSSVIAGSSVRVELYKESQYGGGTPLRVNAGQRIPRLAPSGFDNIISSIKVLNP